MTCSIHELNIRVVYIGDSKGGHAPLPIENYVLRNLEERLQYRLAVLAFFMFLTSILSHFKP